MSRVFSLLVLVALLAVAARGPVAAQEPCRFVQGFATLRELVGAEKVGRCLEDEHFNMENGNAEQRTSGGLLVWRKADNFTAFTDGGTTWVNGPNGLESRPNAERFSWERDPVQTGAAPAPSSSPQAVASRPPASPSAVAAATATSAPAANAPAPTPTWPIARDPNAGVAPASLNDCPESHPVKGNQGSRDDDDWIYHPPGSRSYAATQPERCFRTNGDAASAGYRAPER